MQHPPRKLVIDWLNTIWETDLPSQSKLIACNLRRRMTGDHDCAWPSIRTIARECGMGTGTVQKYLDVLVSEGWVLKESGDRKNSNQYRIAIPGVYLHQIQGVSPPDTGVYPHQTQNKGNKNKASNKVYVQEVVDLYHSILFDLPGVKVITDKREKQILARKKEVDANGGWRQFFAAVQRSDFLMGRKSDWKADLEWITKQSNFIKIIEGKYH